MRYHVRLVRHHNFFFMKTAFDSSAAEPYNTIKNLGKFSKTRQNTKKSKKLIARLMYVKQNRSTMYRGMFETLKSGNKTGSGEIDLNIKTLAIPKVGQDHVSGGVSVLC